ncbi:uncharacterized protein LOC114264281 [Camellia sinensis]|uniref:uncharacterized protein LOC114264281 n=1 Tax=Camellia sinensis TaxID=4442 RepID=UPI001036BFC2|nr:uncharacterized protein LOC114264281 [Camellia sinensis]
MEPFRGLKFFQFHREWCSRLDQRGYFGILLLSLESVGIKECDYFFTHVALALTHQSSSSKRKRQQKLFFFFRFPISYSKLSPKALLLLQIFNLVGVAVSKHFNNVLKAVLRFHGLLLKKPEPITANCTDDRWSCFQNCLGALDGTYVKVLAPVIDKPRYRTRKGEIATNVLGVCSQDMQFIYVLPGWEGSASDSRVLRDAVSRPNGLKVPTGHYYLVDAGYTNGEGFLAPYRGQCYHLSTWREGGAPTTPQEFFNMRHSSARNVIERCFGLLKMRWAILRTYSYFPIKTQFRIITACCLLHNLIQREMPMDLDDDENEEMNPPPLATELGDEMIDVVKASDQWSEWRTALATQMFNEWQASRGMDDTGTTSSRKKAKPRRFWNHREEVFLITTMKDVIASNPRWKLDNNQFRAGFYNECEKKILSAFPGTDLRASPHIDSKIKFWRKQYNALQDMLNMSGFGWNDEQKMVLVDSDDVWQNYVRRVPDAKGMRNRPFPFYEDWLILFGKDRATGELAEDPADAVAAMEKEDANATTEEGEQSPVEQFSMNMGDTDYSMSTAGNVPNRADSAKTGKKRARPTEGIPTELSEMAKNLGSFIENTNTTMVEVAHRIGYSHDLSQQRRLVNAELLKLPMSNTQRLMAASMIVKDEDKVDLFFSLDENDKMEWVSLLLEGHI